MPVEVTTLLLPTLVPLALVLMPITIVWKKLHFLRNRIDQRRFARCMTLKGRIIPYADALQRTKNGIGTLLYESFSFKGPYLVWWTEEDVLSVSPHPGGMYTGNYGDDILEESFPFYEWARDRYTHPENGQGLLVILPRKIPKNLFEGVRYMSLWPFGRMRSSRPEYNECVGNSPETGA